jgi:hypothetical protein
MPTFEYDACGVNMNEISQVRSPLPLKAPGPFSRFWIKLQSAGLLKSIGLAREPVRIEAYKILDALRGRSLFRVTISCKGVTAGANSTVSVSEALQKAFSELCEIFELSDREYGLGQTRNGFATHQNEASAREYAYRELIERDSLITHFLCPQVRATPLSCPDYASLPAKLARLWSADPTIQVVLSGLRDGPDGPWFLGAGAAESLEAATEKAYLECVSSYCGYRHADEAMHLVGQRKLDVLRHVWASKDEPMTSNLRSIFSGKGELSPDFTTSVAQANFRSFGSRGGFVVVSASHDCLCPLTFGKVWDESEQSIIDTLQRRGLEPVWLLHPFA